MDPNLLFMICTSSAITCIIAGMRQHWAELCVFLFLAVASGFGFVMALMALTANASR